MNDRDVLLLALNVNFVGELERMEITRRLSSDAELREVFIRVFKVIRGDFSPPGRRLLEYIMEADLLRKKEELGKDLNFLDYIVYFREISCFTALTLSELRRLIAEDEEMLLIRDRQVREDMLDAGIERFFQDRNGPVESFSIYD